MTTLGAAKKTLMPSVATQSEDTDIKYIEIKQKPSRTIALVRRKNSSTKK